MLQIASPRLSWHINPTPAGLPVHPTQGELGILIPCEANVSMSEVPLEAELFVLLPSLGATLLLTVSKSQPSECQNLIILSYSTSCYKELKRRILFATQDLHFT